MDSACLKPRESNETRIRPGVYHTANGTFANDCQYAKQLASLYSAQF